MISVSDDRIRYQVADMLKNHGERVQYSVFECHLTRRQLQALRSQVSQLLDKNDSARWYPLCRWCRKDIGSQGKGGVTTDPDFFEI
jgi:CRISPR-associated protein Cas2